MIPSWYDVLDVEPGATTDEIRAAWKSSVADLDPTDRRFKQRNRAAEVLLDPQRRAAHDADLADQDEAADELDGVSEPVAEAPTPKTSPKSAPKSAPKSTSKSTSKSTPKSTPKSTTRGGGTTAAGPTLTKTRAEPTTTTPSRTSSGADAAAGADADVRWRRIATAVGVLALALLVATVVALTAGGSTEGDEVAADGALPDAREVAAARAAAEAAIGPVLSFDYRDLDASQAAAVSFMTTDYAETYRQNFAGFVAENAPTTRTIVTAEVVSSGIVRTGEDRVDILLFVNRPTRNASGDKVSRDQVTVQMRDVDGRWLVDCLVTAAGGSCED